MCVRACVHVHTCVHVLDREGSRVSSTTSSSTDSLVSDLADLPVSVTHFCHLRGHTPFCKMCCIITGLALVRRSSEIQGTALGKCLQAWLVYTGPCLRV